MSEPFLNQILPLGLWRLSNRGDQHKPQHDSHFFLRSLSLLTLSWIIIEISSHRVDNLKLKHQTWLIGEMKIVEAKKLKAFRKQGNSDDLILLDKWLLPRILHTPPCFALSQTKITISFT